MRTIREVLRLKLDCGWSDRQIAQSTGLARRTIGESLRRFHASGVLWPLSAALPARDLTACLFPPVPVIARDQRPVPDWPQVQAELRRKGVTLTLLWQEYKAANPDGFQYAWFCDSYQAWRQ
jgi:transposase